MRLLQHEYKNLYFGETELCNVDISHFLCPVVPCKNARASVIAEHCLAVRAKRHAQYPLISFQPVIISHLQHM